MAAFPRGAKLGSFVSLRPPFEFHLEDPTVQEDQGGSTRHAWTPARLVRPAWRHLGTLAAAEPVPERYELLDLIGSGGTSRVYAAFDRELEREVAIKIIRIPHERDRARCLREGRVMASLGHPNILPIYDVGGTDASIYFTMPRFTGQSLADRIRAAVTAGHSEVLPVTALVELVLKLCDALGYAHARGVIHGDIKPANVLIGEFGEVVLVDWGAATVRQSDASSSGRTIGTPAYMSPEQARGEAVTARSDVYALGATLFHALLLRRALTTDAWPEFWRRKRAGELDAPTARELRRVPRPLLGVALKAMAHEPSDRYPSVGDVAQALRDFLAGRSAWAAPSVSESFLTDDYLERWVEVAPGDFVREEGRLVSGCARGGLLIYNQRLSAGVAVEFDGEILDGARPGDLSVLWTDEDVLEGGPHWPAAGSAFTLQIAAFANLHAGIYRGFQTCLSGRSLSIEVGRRYRIRAEINDQSLRLLLDGEVVADYENLFPFSSGYLALYSYYPGKAFSDVRLFERGLPERMGPTAIGDAFFARGERTHAALQYSRVEQLLPNSKHAQEARYKRGLCLLTDGDAARAEEVWNGLEEPTWRARAALHATDVAFAAGRHDHVLAEIRRLKSTMPELERAIVARWTEYVNRLCAFDADALSGYLDLRDDLFRDHQESATAAAAAELARGNFARVLERFPEQHLQMIEAFSLLGQFEQVVERYGCAPWLRDIALLHLGRFDEPELSLQSRALVRLWRGDPEGSLELSEHVEALLAAGRFERVLAITIASPEEIAAALRGLGRRDGAVERTDARALALANVDERVLAGPLRLRDRLFLTEHLGLESLLRGDQDAYRRHVDRLRTLPCAATWPDVWVARYVLFPLADELAGEQGAFAESLRESVREREWHWFGKLSYLARYVLGELSDAEFFEQPCRLYVEARQLFARALRAELARDATAAERAYREFLALPDLERHLDSSLGNPLVDRWARSRLSALA
jgi:hypothetical protein